MKCAIPCVYSDRPFFSRCTRIKSLCFCLPWWPCNSPAPRHPSFRRSRTDAPRRQPRQLSQEFSQEEALPQHTSKNSCTGPHHNVPVIPGTHSSVWITFSELASLTFPFGYSLTLFLAGQSVPPLRIEARNRDKRELEDFYIDSIDCNVFLPGAGVKYRTSRLLPLHPPPPPPEGIL